MKRARNAKLRIEFAKAILQGELAGRLQQSGGQVHAHSVMDAEGAREMAEFVFFLADVMVEAAGRKRNTWLQGREKVRTFRRQRGMA